MDKNLLDKSNAFVKQLMHATGKALNEVQENPIGAKKRSKREFGTILKEMQAMPSEERQVKMKELAILSGHEGDKLDGCELCEFIKEAMLKKG